MIDRSQFAMRAPCRCGHTMGRIVEKSGQDTVRCLACDSYCYCAPRVETGREVRNVKTREGLRPGKRAEILMRDGSRCVLCGTREGIMHIGHIIGLEYGLRAGISADDLDDEENLAVMCEACNLGIGEQPIPLRTAIAIVRARIAWREAQK